MEVSDADTSSVEETESGYSSEVSDKSQTSIMKISNASEAELDSDLKNNLKIIEKDTDNESLSTNDQEENKVSVDQTLRYPRRNRKPTKSWYIASSAENLAEINITTSDDPTIAEAFRSTQEEQALWEAAIEEELLSLESNNAWVPDDSPKQQPLPTHAILKIKRKADGKVERFKARVVAGGNHQVYDTSYMETYAPVVSFTMVRIFLYLALCLKLCIGKLDVRSAFLKGELSESVWVMSPRGIPSINSQCYRLLKSMYGLKQAHLAWHTKLCADLLSIGFEELRNGSCVFSRKDSASKYAYLLVYVDDILVLANSNGQRNDILEELVKNLNLSN